MRISWLSSRPALAVAVAAGLALTPGLIAAGPASARSGVDEPGGDAAAAQAARVYRTQLPPLATVGDVKITGGAYGSSLFRKPGSQTHFYGLTDRGPNVDSPTGGKIEPLPDFQPAIGEFVIHSDGSARQVANIPLAAHDGAPYNGQVNPGASTNETITDLDGKTLPTSTEGYDPEGLVMLKDGTFWVSDEYGPFVTHFDKTGRAIERLSPFDGTLPRELAEREPNKGMEGLTITPDGTKLVGVMQSGLNAPNGPKSKNLSVVRIVTIGLSSRQSREYLYVLHNTDGATTAVSEITALDDHRFLIDERDGNLEPGANKKIFVADLTRATDVGPRATLAGATYDRKAGGLLVGGKTIEAIAGSNNTAATASALDAADVVPATSKLWLDVGGLVSAIDPTGGYFGHDKVEGVALLDGGRKVLISNDNDFGISGVNETQAPFTLKAKLLPDGTQDDGELLLVDLAKVPAAFR